MTATVQTISRVIVVNFPTMGGAPTQLVKNADYTFALSDGTSKGVSIYHSSVQPHVYTLPRRTSVDFPAGEGIMVVNALNAGSVTVQMDLLDGDTLHTDGTGATTSVVVPACTSAFFMRVSTTDWRAYPGA